MKSQVRFTNRYAELVPAATLRMAAMGLAAAVLIAGPLRAHAHEAHGMAHGQMHSAMHGAMHSAAGHEPAAHAVRADWHGGGGFHGGVAPGARVGWHGGADGRWEHSWHGGHYGWWYINAGIWSAYPYYPYGYPYGYPYYTYPGPYAYGYAPQEAAAYNGNLPAPQQTWYYCDAARAYYPAVQSCPAGWRPVTPQAGPPPAAAAAAPPAPRP